MRLLLDKSHVLPHHCWLWHLMLFSGYCRLKSNSIWREEGKCAIYDGVHTFIVAYISNPTTLWVHYFLAKLGGNLFIMKLIFPDQSWGLRSWSPEGTRLESPRDTVSRVMVAVSSGLQTAKGSLAFFWHLPILFRGKLVLTDVSPTG